MSSGAPTLDPQLERQGVAVTDGRISVFLADDNLIVREGVRALLDRQKDIEVVGVADDYDSLVAGAEEPTRKSWSPTSACHRRSSARASRRPSRCASATRAPAS